MKHADFNGASGLVSAGANYNGGGKDWNYKIRISVNDIES